jgi:CubicO group peptidase (beta-lactamase class C family)
MSRRPLLTLLAVALGLTAGWSVAQTTTLPPGTLRQYLKLKDQTPAPDTGGDLDSEPTDPLGLAVALPEIRDTIAAAMAQAPTPVQAPLIAADQAFAQAHTGLLVGMGDGSVRFLRDSINLMAQGQTALDQALDIAAAIDPQSTVIRLLLPAVQKCRDAAARSSQSVIDIARAAQRQGDALHAAGDYGGAVGQYANGFGFAADTIVFDMDRFVQNLRSVFDTQSVGWSYAVTLNGALARSGNFGLARTAADLPATAQSSSKKMHVASTSKMMTAIVLLRLLNDRGVSVDAAIGPWLPATWARGVGVDSITFRQLLTHRSGFGQNSPGGSAWDALQAMVAQAVPAQGSYDYDNANFGLMRVLVSTLQGVDPTQLPNVQPGPLSAAVFAARAVDQFNAIGVPFSCDPQPSNPTLQYEFPDTGNPGYVEPPRALVCGGYGVFISARNLVRSMVYLRYTQDLMPTPVFQQMKAGYLGFMNPAQYGFAQGAFGVYFGHGGDWDHTGSGGLDSCTYMFPISVEAAVLVNSSRKSSGVGYSNGPHQCGVLKWAFDNAWAAN